MISDPPLCTFCEKDDETLDHLFIDCSLIQPLWKELERILSHEFSRQEKIFGCFNDINDKHFDVISHCSLLLRYYIHICRLNKQPPNTNLLIKRIIYTSDLELLIATKKKKTDRHHQIWSPFFDLIESDVSWYIVLRTNHDMYSNNTYLRIGKSWKIQKVEKQKKGNMFTIMVHHTMR